MAFEFPEFKEPSAIDARRSWTAIFDSYDQRNDDVYYWVTVTEDGREVARFMVLVGLSWAGEDNSGPAFRERLRREIRDVAVTGKANTSYTGPLGFHRK